MSNGIIKLVSNYIGWDSQYTIQISLKAPTSYKRYLIPKKNGEYRSIFHPAQKTKSLQYALIDVILTKLPIHSQAFAYKNGLKSPLRKNALLHLNFSYSIRLDMKDFFPSIVPDDLIKILNAEDPLGMSRQLSETEIMFMKNVLFIKHPTLGVGLAIGAPSSPIISNCVMYKIDDDLHKYSIRKNGVYSRYADDIVFSSNKKIECIKFRLFVLKILDKYKSPKLTVNDDKTMLMSRGTRRIITGLCVTHDKKISIGRDKKRYIRKLIYDIKCNKIDAVKLKYVQGYIAYIMDVEPSLYNSLIIKYGSDPIYNIMKYPLIINKP